METVKCSGCGKYIHKASVCLYCGNSVGFDMIEEAPIHTKAALDCARIYTLIEEKKYNEAIELSCVVQEYMPNLAELYWLRLLSRNKCSSDVELLRKGFDIEDADFCNALEFSTGKEHKMYVELQKTISEIRQKLLESIFSHENRCKLQTGILELGKNLPVEMEKRKERLFSLWADLENTEHALSVLEMDCGLVVREYRNSLDEAAQTASSLKNEIYRMDECISKNQHYFQIMLETTLRLSDTSKEAIENMKKQHPWVKTFQETLSVRDEQMKRIQSEIASLVDYEKTVQKLLAEIEQVEGHHKSALLAAEKYNFTDAAALLGEYEFERILQRAGIHTKLAGSFQFSNGIMSMRNGVRKRSDSRTGLDLNGYNSNSMLSDQ